MREHVGFYRQQISDNVLLTLTGIVGSFCYHNYKLYYNYDFYRHCGFVVYQSEMEAERVARMAHHKVVRRKRIVARGPAEQRSKGHSGEYEGKLGYVPTCKNDKRRLTDCIHYTNGDCTSGTEV